jgi:hypothetical protein
MHIGFTEYEDKIVHFIAEWSFSKCCSRIPEASESLTGSS